MWPHKEKKEGQKKGKKRKEDDRKKGESQRHRKMISSSTSLLLPLFQQGKPWLKTFFLSSSSLPSPPLSFVFFRDFLINESEGIKKGGGGRNFHALWKMNRWPGRLWHEQPNNVASQIISLLACKCVFVRIQDVAVCRDGEGRGEERQEECHSPIGLHF